VYTTNEWESSQVEDDKKQERQEAYDRTLAELEAVVQAMKDNPDPETSPVTCVSVCAITAIKQTESEDGYAAQISQMGYMRDFHVGCHMANALLETAMGLARVTVEEVDIEPINVGQNLH
jgi:hypothetical protein